MANIWKFLRGLFGSRSAALQQDAESVETIAYVHGDDPEIQAAWQLARESVAQFIDALEDPGRQHADFYVKKRFEEGGRTEHIWLSDVRLEGQEFCGLIGNDPRIVSDISFGDQSRVAMDDISDWMIINGEETEGGFTVELLMQRRGQQ